MNILCISTAFNELEYLPYKKKFCDYHGLNLYVIDNYSNDGTWEWLQDNKVPSHRFDTQEMFALELLQNEMVRTLRSLKHKPDWVIYSGIDMFPVSLPSIKNEIIKANDQGYNLIGMPKGGLSNTGEDRSKNPFDTYLYGSIRKDNHSEVFIHKYHDSIQYQADAVSFTSVKNNLKRIKGFIIDYGNTKTAEQRNLIYARRQKAWLAGVTPKSHGVHYTKGNSVNWLWDKDKLIDFRLTDDFQYLKHLQDICK